MRLEDIISNVLCGEAEPEAIYEYCDAMQKTNDNLQELIDAIECYDCLDLYICLFSLFADELSEEEIRKYRAKFKQVFDESLHFYVEETFDFNDQEES